MAKNFLGLSDYEDYTTIIDAWFAHKALTPLVKYKVIGETTMPNTMDVKFLPEYIEEAFDYSLLIIINPHLLSKFTDEDVLLTLMNEKLNVIGFDYNKGTVKKLKNDYITSITFQEKVGAEKLIQAKTIEQEMIASYKEDLKNNK